MVMPHVTQTATGFLLLQPRLQSRDIAFWIYGGRSVTDTSFCPNRWVSVWMAVTMVLP